MQSLMNFFDRLNQITNRFDKLFHRNDRIKPAKGEDFKSYLDKAAAKQTDQEVKVDIKGHSVGIDGPYSEIIQKASDRYHVPDSLIRSVIKQESNFNPQAVSKKGAMGLMQLMPSTAKSLSVSNPFSPEENIMGGSAYLKKMFDLYDGDWVKALAAYNAGPEALDNGKVPNYPETHDYVKKVMKNYLKNNGIEP